MLSTVKILTSWYFHQQILCKSALLFCIILEILKLAVLSLYSHCIPYIWEFKHFQKTFQKILRFVLETFLLILLKFKFHANVVCFVFGHGWWSLHYLSFMCCIWLQEEILRAKEQLDKKVIRLILIYFFSKENNAFAHCMGFFCPLHMFRIQIHLILNYYFKCYLSILLLFVEHGNVTYCSTLLLLCFHKRSGNFKFIETTKHEEKHFSSNL